MIETVQPEAAAAKILERREARRDLVSWSRLCGYEPAKHHRVILDHLGGVERGEVRRLMIMTPPGSAKSTYASYLFPPHYFANNENKVALCTSHNYTLIESWGRKCRNLIDLHSNTLGYTLQQDSRAAGEWETTNGCRYYCAGVGAGIAGHRADLGMIDDFVGDEVQASSDTYNETVWNWYWADFWPRLKPNSAQVIICNHRKWNDLVGRLLEKEASKWLVIKFPFFAEENDVLGRLPGERLWPEYFTEEQAEGVAVHPEKEGLYQQNPDIETGSFFQRDWIVNGYYDKGERPPDLNIYTGSDHACTDEVYSDHSCCLSGGVDEAGTLWLLEDILWGKMDTGELVEGMIAMMKRLKPRTWWAERGQISKSIGPFLKDRMLEEQVFTYIEDSSVAKDKKARAQSIRGRMKIGRVRWPRYAPWMERALKQMVRFGATTGHDDFVDALAHLGLGLEKMIPCRVVIPKTYDMPPNQWHPTFRWLKGQEERRQAKRALVLLDR